MIFLGYFCALVYGVICLALASLLYKLGVPKKYTRKVVHILIGAEWFILYHTVGMSIHFIAVCLIFTALIWISYAKSLMPMISSDKDNAPGTVYYCISMTVMSVISYFHPAFALPFGIAVLCTSVGDGFACVIGNLIKVNPKIYKNKTLFGTAAAFLFSFLSVLVFAKIYNAPLTVGEMLLIALFAAGLELVTGFGLDNITLPLCSAAFSYLLLSFEWAGNYSVPIVLTPFIIALVLEKRLLTVKGVLLAVVCDVAVSVSLGNFGFVYLLSFLLLSVIIDKVKKHVRGNTDDITKRGEHRDGVQVLANGIIPVIAAILFLITQNGIFIVCYCASLAECFADSAASGIGMLSHSAYDIVRFKKIPVGLSGGVSLIGTLASLLSAFAFPLIALAFGRIDIKWVLLSGVCAFAGVLLDSLLGSLLQVKYRCTVCGKVTERTEHCGADTEKIGGISLINNDAVNVLSCAFSAVLAAVIYVFV